VHEYLIRYDAAGVADQWINLDNVKYSMQGARVEDDSFWVTLHYEQKHPDFLLQPREFALMNVRWKPKMHVRMFWRSEEHPAGGEYWTGEVVEHADGPDPWDSVHVKWDADDGEEEDLDWVCPWELQVNHGPSSVVARHSSSNTHGMCVRNAAEVLRMPRGGYYTCIDDDDSPQSIAQKRGLDIELIVMLNKEMLKGLTKYSKLLNGTKVKLPCKGYRYQRSGGTVINTGVEGPAEMTFPKEDMIFWEGPWTDEKRKISDDVLRKITRQRGIGPFLTPVDYEALNLVDYTKVVTAPMDLGTVEARFRGTDGEQKYAMPKDYYLEMKLVFENSKRYNPIGTELYRKSVNFLNQFEDWWRAEWKHLASAERDEQIRKRKAAEKESAYKKKKAAMAAMLPMGASGPPISMGTPAPGPTSGYPQIPSLSFTMPSAFPPGDSSVGDAGSDRKSTVTCGICGADGHNRRTCPQMYGTAQGGALSGYP